MTTVLDNTMPPTGTETMNDEETARFVKKHYRPEVWRSEIPLIVKVLCKGHPERLAVWLSISWLLDFYDAEGKDGFGTREIASDSGIGRNQITRYVRELADLGLLEIIGYERISGKNPRGLRPRPRYDINWAELERRSLLLLPQKIREHGIHHPPVIKHPPEQMTLDFGIDSHTGLSGTSASVSGASSPEPSDSPVPGVARGQDSLAPEYARGGTRAGQSGTQAGQPDSPVPEVAHQRASAAEPVYSAPVSTEAAYGNDTWHAEMPATGTQNGQPMPAPGTHTIQDCHSPVPLEGEREGKKEGESETPTPADIRMLAAETARAVFMELFQHMPALTSADIMPTPANPIPIAPAGHPQLPATVLELWGADREHVAQRDIFQLDSLAAEYDLITDGHGAYWLGQAILMAERCLESKGQRPTIPYIRAVLKRWEQEGSWGSDTEEPEPGRRPAPRVQDATTTEQPAPCVSAPAPRTNGSAPTSQAASTPAVEQYTRLTGQQPNAVQVDAIAQTVTDLEAWQRIITDWQAHGWNVANVADMLDRYRRQTGTQPQEERVSDLPIIMHPELQDEERDDWLYRFRHAATPADKRAILEQLKREHPLNDEPQGGSA